ncbi:hypothetical protein J3L16_11740 [Alteromonas sp. 5E99-2]|uniref:hypothetical protein n=1 Tax=Alteromonas sp. 5E99-2 TaxID=2817683 RepID=UPI001A99BC28|nr:hypothetical protein [Alteromonas sp. 5E99-2]MBO1256354.1 hypothetical protein [Alteromonas sp. 5E99-2]
MRVLGFLLLGLLSTSNTHAEGPEVSTCPNKFHSLTVHEEAKLCQIFDSTPPFSMVYHVKEMPDDVIAFFLRNKNLSMASRENNRTLIMNDSKTHRVVVSPDGNGSQIDILVINPSS